MKRSTWIYAGAGAVAAVAALAWAFAPRPVEVEAAAVTRGPFEATVEEDAKTRVRDRYVVSALLAGQLGRIALREGDTVGAGAVLATLTPVLSPLLDERTLREQQHRVESARANADRVNARIERAKVAVLQAANEARRSEQLAQQGFVAPTKLETDRLAMLELGDTARMELVAELLTSDALRVTPGSRVVVERWGGEGALEGRVRLIEPGAFTKVSALGVEEQRVRVLIDLTSPQRLWRALGDGYRVGVRIVTLSIDDAVQVPVSAVFPLLDGEGGAAVFVLDEGRAKVVPVDVAARNSSTAWIRRGLAPGAKVVVYPPATVADGKRVRERRTTAS